MGCKVREGEEEMNTCFDGCQVPTTALCPFFFQVTRTMEHCSVIRNLPSVSVERRTLITGDPGSPPLSQLFPPASGSLG